MSDEKLYILFDSRAWGSGGTDDAAVLCTAQSEAEALRDAKMFGASACYAYDKAGSKKKPTLKNETWMWDTDSDGKRINL